MTLLPYNPNPFDTPNVDVSPLSVRGYFPNLKAPIGTWAELWFGTAGHVSPGYRSDDPATVSAQVATVLARGCDFIILDWYGTNAGVGHNAALLLMSECEKQGLKFIIDFDKGIFQFNVPKGVDFTAWGQQQMAFVVKTFMASPAYMKTADGRFLMCTWATAAVTGLDLGKVFGAYPQVAVLYDKATGVSKPASAGCYGWVGNDASNPEGAIEAYQTSFLIAAMKAKKADPTVIVMASVPSGFDDHGRRPGLDPTKSCWDQTAPYRFVDYKQGQTLLNVVDVVNEFQPDYIFIPTFNDYDEGTTCVERGIDSKVAVSLSVANGQLTWTLSGNLKTVDHVELHINGQIAAKLRPQAVDTLVLTDPASGVATFQCQVVAIGRPLFQNKASNAVSTTAKVVPVQTAQVQVPVHIDTSVSVPVSGTAGGLTVQGTVIVPVVQDSVATVTATVTTQTIWS